MDKPIIGISMGDPFGIGPEICVKAVTDPAVLKRCRPVIVGDLSVIQKAAELTGIDREVQHWQQNETGREYGRRKIQVCDTQNETIDTLSYGTVSAGAGDAAFRAIEKNIELAMEGTIDATVTAPIHKESLNRAGHNFAGHTEIYARYTNTDQVAMLLADGNFRVIHVSTHVSLAEACRLVKKDRVLHVIRLLHEACVQFGIDKPKLAVCGLNPHAGDGGLFGREEEQEIIPAVEEAAKNGIRVEGPYPADTLYPRVVGGFYDGCVAMYHDQGHIPFKVKGFEWDQESSAWSKIRGVNITLGIPIIRVSVDHGTAFDIAGQGIASPQSLVHAIQYAVQMVG
ncbi:4-hydroxythreonine-4-phosphate dehydrogenase PdxA [Halalkalibaculum sp. DA384]|uniref:4-hydroxythreonine-4-phosphate dehydrogenase PdxA n=1 Tax=Halalkalibaculum sp. DA384 TaxID=3373606 RepID=UPI003753F542